VHNIHPNFFIGTAVGCTSIILHEWNDKKSSNFLNPIFLASGDDYIVTSVITVYTKLAILGLGPLGLSGGLPPNPFV